MASETTTGWRPIATAPKGEYVLLWEPEANLRHDGLVMVGHYVDIERFGEQVPPGYHNGWFDNVSGRFEIQPTHWQPLPQPPDIQG